MDLKTASQSNVGSHSELSAVPLWKLDKSIRTKLLTPDRSVPDFVTIGDKEYHFYVKKSSFHCTYRTSDKCEAVSSIAEEVLV